MTRVKLIKKTFAKPEKMASFGSFYTYPRVRPEVNSNPSWYSRQTRVNKALRILDREKEPYRIRGDWVRLPREIMDALEYEGINERYVKTRESIVDFSTLDEPEWKEIMKEV